MTASWRFPPERWLPGLFIPHGRIASGQKFRAMDHGRAATVRERFFPPVRSELRASCRLLIGIAAKSLLQSLLLGKEPRPRWKVQAEVFTQDAEQLILDKRARAHFSGAL